MQSGLFCTDLGWDMELRGHKRYQGRGDGTGCERNAADGQSHYGEAEVLGMILYMAAVPEGRMGRLDSLVPLSVGTLSLPQAGGTQMMPRTNQANCNARAWSGPLGSGLWDCLGHMWQTKTMYIRVAPYVFWEGLSGCPREALN